MWHIAPHDIRTDGTTLHASIFQEDGGVIGGVNAFLGHRHAATGALGVNGIHDRFEPVRAYGCVYLGSDAPGLNLIPYPGGERRRFSLEFRGAAVNACASRARVGDWHHWRVFGEYIPGSSGPTQGPGHNKPPSNVITRRPPRIVGPQLATPLPAGLAIEIERKWQSDPHSLCLDDQISCGAATYVDEMRRSGASLTDVARDEALTRERAALSAHCDRLGKMSLEALGDSLDALAARRLDNFLHWGELVGDHALEASCPDTD
jgi:hypothetical protein